MTNSILAHQFGPIVIVREGKKLVYYSDEAPVILHFLKKTERNAAIIISILFCSLFKNNSRDKDFMCFHTEALPTVQTIIRMQVSQAEDGES